MNCKVCGNTSAKNNSISFFRFPKENSKCRDWARRCDLLELFEKYGTLRFYKSFRICSQHFDPKDVVFDGRKNRLLQTATPLTAVAATNPSIQANAQHFNIQLPQNLCRLCAEENDELTDIFGWRGRLLNLESKLKYFPQQINKHDILPLKICNECIEKINQFYDFIMNCTKAETKLRAMLDLKDCNSSCQLTKSDADSDEKVDWDSGMEMTLHKTPKTIHSSDSITLFPDNVTGNYYCQVFGKDFIADDDDDVRAYLCGAGESDFPTTNYSRGHTNSIKVEFSNNVSVEHDYSNTMSRDQSQVQLEMQASNDQTFLQPTQFTCDVCLVSFHDSEALNAHSLTHSVKWDLNRERLSELYVFSGRFQLEHAPPSQEGKCACEVCDKKLPEVAFLDNHSLVHQLQTDLRPCQIRQESKTKAQLKRLLKSDQTESSLIRELKHFNPEGRSYRSWERFTKDQDGLTGKETRAEESHRCSECGKYFRSKASLRQHRSVHSEKRVHNCRECGMSFKRKDTLCNHLRIHTGERPFMCKICGFAFKQRGDCIKHERNHNNHSEVVSKGESVRVESEIWDSVVLDQFPVGNARQ